MTNQATASLEELCNKVETVFKQKYEEIEFQGKEKETWFKISDKHFVRADRMLGNYNCLLLEHVNSMEKRYLAEDGDLFCPEDYENEEQLIEAVIREAEEELKEDDE